MSKELIEDKDSLDMYVKDMVLYSIIVNRRRSIPEMRDGLKPVQRRIIYDMYKQGAISYNKRIKSTAVQGDTMKNLHPHGDASIYAAMEPMANWYKSKVPLIAPHGNWGSLMGDGVAAARYTEAGLSDFCFDCIIGELKDTKGAVDWIDNYSRTCKEPEYLPVKVPLLIINGTSGIGVGMNVNIPNHNLVEVCEAARVLMKNPKADIILAPDFCQPCKIVTTKENITEISHTGSGSYIVRGIVDIGEDEKGYPTLYIKSLPDDINTSQVIDQLNKLVVNKQLPMVKDVLDASTLNVDIRVQLRKGTDPFYVKQVLYTKTSVQATVPVNLRAVKGVDVIRFNYKQYLMDFIEQRIQTKFRLYCNKLKDYKTRHHILDVYIKVIESGELDAIINMIKKQSSTDDTTLVEFLIKKVPGITDIQARYLLNDLNLKKLSKGYLKKYKEEDAELQKIIPLYQTYITDGGKEIIKEIDRELLEIENKYGKPRICNIVSKSDDSNIPHGIFKVIITKNNYVRKVPENMDKISVRHDDPKFIMKVDNVDNLLIFDCKGKVFKLPVSRISVSDKQSAGIDIRVLIKNATADIIAVVYEPMLLDIAKKSKSYLVVTTLQNTIKKLEIEDFLNVSVSGLMYSKIKDDAVTGLNIVSAGLDIVLYTDQKILRTSINNIPLFKRNATGSKAMSTAPVLGMDIIYPDDTDVVVITNKGRINRFPISVLARHGRGGVGINGIRLTNGDIIASVRCIRPTDEIRILTTDNVINIPVSSLESKSTVATGSVCPGFIKGSSVIRTDVLCG